MTKKKVEEEEKKEAEVCPKCGSALAEIATTKNGKRFQRCSTGSWNAETHQVDGCNYIKWLPVEPEVLDEKCPKCGAPLVLTTTRFGKRMKKCSTNSWDPKTKTASGCDYVEWLKGTTEELEEDCPKCGSKLVLFTSSAGKKLKKCSTNKWDPEARQATGCDYTQWL